MKNRNAKGGGSVRQRDNGTWEARCTINGKSKSFYGKRQSDALKAMRAALAASDEGTYCEPKKFTLSQWLDIWLNEYVQPSVKPLTYAAYRSKVETHIKPSLGNIKMALLNPTQVQTFYNDLLRKKKLSKKTIKDVHGILHKAIDQAVELNYIPTNATDPCKLSRPDNREILPFTETDIEAFLTAIDGHQFEPLFTVTLFTGMREGEVCGLPWDAVNFKKGTITIKQQLSKINGEHVIVSTKNDRIRVLTVSPFLMDILCEVRTKQLQNHLASGTTWKNEYNLVFTNEEGHFVYPQTVYKKFKNIAAQIGRPDARFHDLRHTYAVTALQEGDDSKTVQQNLGHATAAFTLNVYGHVSEKMKQESANRMQKYYENIKA
jgi:integrase